METKNVNLAVLKTSIKYLRVVFLFPTESELKDSKSNIHWKYIVLNLFTIYFPIGVLIHMFINIKRSMFTSCICHRQKLPDFSRTMETSKVAIAMAIGKFVFITLGIHTIPVLPILSQPSAILSNVAEDDKAVLRKTSLVGGQTYYFIDRDIGIILAYNGALYFTGMYIRNLRKILSVCKQCSDFETFGKPKDFDKKNAILDKMSTIYVIYVITDLMLSGFYALFNTELCENFNVAKSAEEVCGLIASTYFPFNIDYFPLKHIVFVYQLFSILVTVHTGAFISYVMMETIENVVIRLNHVKYYMAKVINEEDPIKRKILFRKSVRYHIAVMEMANLTTSAFSPCMMVHICLTSPILGCAAYRMAVEHSFDSLLLFICWNISTCLVCTAGQRMVDAFTSIDIGIYENNLYLLDTSMQKDFQFIMMRCLRPIYLRAGPFGYMNYSMLMLIFKTSYSYINLLMQTI